MKKEDAGARKSNKDGKMFFSWFESREKFEKGAQAAGTETSGETRDEKLHAAVALKVQHTSGSQHVWKVEMK